MSRFTLAAMLGAALSAAACSNNPSTLPTTPTPTPTIVTDTFNGTLARNGATTFPFSVSSTGAVTATLTTVSDSSILVGMSLGVWNGAASSCSALLSNDQAAQGATILGTASGIGTLCLRVYDIGRVVDPIDYTVTVQHP
jgi:hypothetical protein